jgi:hypothetical protein
MAVASSAIGAAPALTSTRVMALLALKLATTARHDASRTPTLEYGSRTKCADIHVAVGIVHAQKTVAVRAVLRHMEAA